MCWTQIDTGRHEWLGHAVVGGCVFKTSKSLERVHVPQWDILRQVPQKGLQAVWHFLGRPLDLGADVKRASYAMPTAELTALGNFIGRDFSRAWMSMSGVLTGIAIHGAAALGSIRLQHTHPVAASTLFNLAAVYHLDETVGYGMLDIIAIMFPGSIDLGGDYQKFGSAMKNALGGSALGWTLSATGAMSLTLPLVLYGRRCITKKRMPQDR